VLEAAAGAWPSMRLTPSLTRVLGEQAAVGGTIHVTKNRK